MQSSSVADRVVACNHVCSALMLKAVSFYSFIYYYYDCYNIYMFYEYYKSDDYYSPS